MSANGMSIVTCANCTKPYPSIRPECLHCGFAVNTTPVAPTRNILMTCTACDYQMSVQASACPRCGHPSRSRKSPIAPALLSLMFAALAVIAIATEAVSNGGLNFQGQTGTADGLIAPVLILGALAV